MISDCWCVEINYSNLYIRKKESLLPLFQKATVFCRVLLAADVFETVTLTTNLLHFACKILRNTLLPISPALKRKFTNSCGYYLWPTTICEWSENCYFTSFECECENGETFSKCKTNLLLYFLYVIWNLSWKFLSYCT